MPDNLVLTNDEQQSSSELRRGQRAVLWISTVAISLTLLLVAYQVSLGMFRFALVGRVVVLLVVCWGMYRARAWARMAFLFLMFLGVINFGLQVPRDPFQLVYAVLYACLAFAVLIPRSVRAHFGV